MDNNNSQQEVIKDDTQSTESVVVRPRHHSKPENEHGRFFLLRQILNIIFMIVAIAGVATYILYNEMSGIIIVVIAMAFKMAECVLRYVK